MRSQPPQIRPRRACALAAAGLALALGAPASATEAPFSPHEVAKTVRQLEAAIRRDRERLMLLVSVPRAPSATPLHEEPELKEIARRLPELQRKLERWARIETGPAARESE